MKTQVIDILLDRIKQSPKKAPLNINYTTQFLTNVALREQDVNIYKTLYSNLESLCGKKEQISASDKEAKEIEVFLNSASQNILFLIESLVGNSPMCALEMYHLHYKGQNDKLLSYTKIENDEVLASTYIDNGANAVSFALTTAVYFFQHSSEFDLY